MERCQDGVVCQLRNWLERWPRCWEARLVLADRHEELGDLGRARLQRWLVKHRKRPDHLEHRNNGVQREATGPYRWYNDLPNAPSEIGPIALVIMPDQGFSTALEAEEALLHLLAACNFEYEPPRATWETHHASLP